MQDQFTAMVYAALLGETTWRHFLEKLAATIPGGTAGLVVHDLLRGEGYGFLAGHAEGAMGPYNEYFAQLNPLQPSLAMRPAGEAVRDDQLYPRSDLARSEFFNDFLVPHGLAHSAGVKVAEADHQSYTLVVASGDAGCGQVRQSVAALAAIAPHLGRAFGFYGREGRRAQRGAQDLLGLLDAPGVAAIVVDGSLRAASVSKAARAMLGGVAPLRIGDDGRVRFRKESVQRMCEQMLKRGYAGPEVSSSHSRHARLTLVRARKSPDMLYFEGTAVAIFMTRRAVAAAPFDPQRFADAYGLTRSELRALSGIVAGTSVDRLAASVGLSRETIRSQTKSLYSKLGVSGASDVLRMVHGEIPD